MHMFFSFICAVETLQSLFLTCFRHFCGFMLYPSRSVDREELEIVTMVKKPKREG